MSAIEYEELGDLESHRVLIQSGYPDIPVTRTTRDLLVRQLRNDLNMARQLQLNSPEFRPVQGPQFTINREARNSTLTLLYRRYGKCAIRLCWILILLLSTYINLAKAAAIFSKINQHNTNYILYGRTLSFTELIDQISQDHKMSEIGENVTNQYFIMYSPPWNLEMLNATKLPFIYNEVERTPQINETFLVLLQLNDPLLYSLRNNLRHLILVLNKLRLLTLIPQVAILIYYMLWTRRVPTLLLEKYLLNVLAGILLIRGVKMLAAVHFQPEEILVTIIQLRDELISLL